MVRFCFDPAEFLTINFVLFTDYFFELLDYGTSLISFIYNRIDVVNIACFRAKNKRKKTKKILSSWSNMVFEVFATVCLESR